MSKERIEDAVRYQLELGPRVPGSDGARNFQKWIISLYEQSDVWNAYLLPFTYKGINVANILITRNGTEFPRYLIGAHYDSRARATQEDPDVPVTGANDGASGVAAIIEMTSLLSAYDSSDIGFLLIDAEDQGYDGKGFGIDGWDWIAGSTYFVENLDQEKLNKLEYFILLDMIGNPDLVLEYEGYSTDWLKEDVWEYARSLGYNNTFIPEYGVSLIDDHRPFLDYSIDAIDIIDFSGYKEWHTTKDTMDSISIDSIAIVTDVVTNYLISSLGLEKITSSEDIMITSFPTLSSNSENAPFPLSAFFTIFVMAVVIRSRRSLVNL